ncbi:FAD-dependent oxidoreductase [Maridesulfovibrio salexigens]|uniref:Pyridine nucleotide-disulphide oxidoreductase dimerisation region n=1 Tax=Maridesulfovibrio salexigens (strain ATCC 14822 / DSM 2638 / NCIMB 8403 / VKM B-1763) TaxID=526222 RepID=C6BYN3_MARSD|nr:FAD-dependent oxidoreductase [Maridesulfovibrio salexigens]ACS80640.1 pyridine nucleotide-disulphide oxidoreductase dimerisation region [Maridesulfovibrio salexigens DSM 2638]
MSEHVVVIGAVALGPKAACRYKRIRQDARVTLIDRDEIFSYGGCGIPYFVSGDVSEANQLRTTAFHMVRDEPFFNDIKGVEVLSSTEATKIDRENKQVHITNLKTGEKSVLDYDQLVIGTGATPRKLGLPGEELENVFYVGNMHDAEKIKEGITKGQYGKAVVVGAGFIGLEMAEAFSDMWGIETTVVEIFDQILPRMCSPVLAKMGQKHMEEEGVSFKLGQTVSRIEGDGKVERVITSDGEVEADIVIISAGVIPNDKLARECGLECSERGGIMVDETMRTTDPLIFSGGDCAIIKNAVDGSPLFLPMGSMANRQGRVIGGNLAGRKETFPAAAGSWCVKIFERAMSGTGMSLGAAKQAGFDAISVMLIMADRAHFYPEKDMMTLEMVVDKATRRVLGIQGISAGGDALVGRINAVAAIMKYQPTIEDVSNLEVAYSPPFASAMDVLNAIANMADNAINGMNHGHGPDIFAEYWDNRESGEYCFLDVREKADAEPFLEKYPEHWHNIPQGEIPKRYEELPKDKKLVLVCNTGGRSYEAQIMLDALGFEEVHNTQGGMAVIKAYGVDI